MLSEEIKKLEQENERLKFDNSILKQTIKLLKLQKSGFEECCKDVIPEKLYITKSRDNTTIKFRSGKSVTVHRHSEDNDSLETAIAYCILKSILSQSDIKSLIKGAIVNE